MNRIFIEPLLEWNLVLIVLGLCSALAFAIFLERMLRLRRADRDTGRLVTSLRPEIRDGNVVEAIELCQQTGGTVASILAAGLHRHERGSDQVEAAMEVCGRVEIANLERNAKILSLIGHIAPLIGLLGTVLGFISAFSEMRLTGLMDISTTRIGEAMEYALITTAAGLAVAIPTIVAYNYLVSRIEALVLESQTASAEILELIQQHAS